VIVSASAEIPDLVLLEPRVFPDARGRFAELYHVERFRDAGLPTSFVQENVSFSHQHVLRGLHLQHPHSQGKLVTVLHGEVFDVAVDVRVGSPTFGRWMGVTLSSDNLRQLWIPPGLAHGFVAITEQAAVLYKVTEPYVPAAERTIRWNDPALGIRWPVGSPSLSPRDADAPMLADVEPANLPRWEPSRA
jgi:dTDP-4-dehydrorhamnose 3,5-epimerase